MKTGTFIQEIGENPGIVSHYVAKGLEDVCNKYGGETAKEFLKKKRFDAVAYHLGLKTIHISEHDTTEIRKPRKRGCFISTWSSRGYMAESRDPLQIGWGSHEDQSLGISAPVLDHTHVFPIRGMDVNHNTVGMGLNDMGNPISKLFTGTITPHGESDSITNWLDYKGYCPTVFYVYKPCQQALESLEEFRDNNYKELPEWKVLELADIKGGYDSVGTTLLFDGGDVPSNVVWWVGSILDYDTTKNYGFKVGNPTGVQVAASMNAAINYMLKHRDKGLLVPEDIDYRELFLKDASRWQGMVLSNEINFE
jgi:homospermidine synthase